MSTTTPSAPGSSVAAALVAELDALGTLPEITSRINALVNDPDSDSDELEQVIRHDPALVARVMRIANSSLYGLRQPVTSVKRAVVMLGFGPIQRVAMAASVGHLFKGKLSARHSAKDWIPTSGTTRSSASPPWRTRRRRSSRSKTSGQLSAISDQPEERVVHLSSC
ncbi:MAG: HDOD domain-containing protein [Tepidisphaeraceae bacterium]